MRNGQLKNFGLCARAKLDLVLFCTYTKPREIILIFKNLIAQMSLFGKLKRCPVSL